MWDIRGTRFVLVKYLLYAYAVARFNRAIHASSEVIIGTNITQLHSSISRSNHHQRPFSSKVEVLTGASHHHRLTLSCTILLQVMHNTDAPGDQRLTNQHEDDENCLVVVDRHRSEEP